MALAFWRRPLLSDEAAKKKGVRDRRAVARERHGLFRCGAFAAARLHAPRSKIFGSGIPIMSPQARTPGRLTTSRLISSARTAAFCYPIHIAQQCGPLTTYRRASCLSASTICRYITAIGRTIGEGGLNPGHIAGRISWSTAGALPIRGPYHEHRQLEIESEGNGYERSPCLQ